MGEQEILDLIQNPAAGIWQPQKAGMGQLWQSVLDISLQKAKGRQDCENECILLYEMGYRLPYSMPDDLFDVLIKLEEIIRRCQPPTSADILLETIIGLAERHPEKASGAAIHHIAKCYLDTAHNRWPSRRPDITKDKRRLQNAICAIVARCPAGNLAQAIAIDPTLFREIAYSANFPAQVTDRICEMQGSKTPERSVFSEKSLEKAFSILQEQLRKSARFGFTPQIVGNIYQALDSIDITFHILPALVTPERLEILRREEESLVQRRTPHMGIINAISAIMLGALERHPLPMTPESLSYLCQHYATDPQKPDQPDNFFLRDLDRMENTLAKAIIYAEPRTVIDMFSRQCSAIKQRTDEARIRPSRQNEMALRFSLLNMIKESHEDMTLDNGYSIGETLSADTKLAAVFYSLNPRAIHDMQVELGGLKRVFPKPCAPMSTANGLRSSSPIAVHRSGRSSLTRVSR